jgi:hypothetical protein
MRRGAKCVDRRDGWFLRRDIVDPAVCARCRDLIWETPGAHPDRMVRDDRSTYVGPFHEDEEGFNGYRWFPRRDVLADNEAFVSVVSQNARVKAIAEQLMGVGEVEEIHSSSVRRSNCEHLAMPTRVPLTVIHTWCRVCTGRCPWA